MKNDTIDNNITAEPAVGQHGRDLQQAELKKVSGGIAPPTPDLKRHGDTDPPSPDAAPNW